MSLPTLNDARSAPSYHPLLPAMVTWLSKMVTEKYDKIVTVFSGLTNEVHQAPPVEGFLSRLCIYSHCSPEVFMQVAVYLTRFMHATSSYLAVQSVHRVIIAAFVVAAKYRDDCVYTNKYYAELGGVPLAELNGLERAFLSAIDWELDVSSEAYVSAVRCLECLASVQTFGQQAVVCMQVPPLTVGWVPLPTSPRGGASSVGYTDSTGSEGNAVRFGADPRHVTTAGMTWAGGFAPQLVYTVAPCAS